MAIGIMEIQNLTNAYRATDAILKNSSVRLIHHRKALGGRLITLVFEGSMSDLDSAFNIVGSIFKDTYFLKVAEVIGRPSKELMRYLEEGSFNGKEGL